MSEGEPGADVHGVVHSSKMRPFGSRRWHRALILFTVIFIFAMITEFGVGWFHQRNKALHKLESSAQELKTFLAYSDHWNIQRLNRGDPHVLSYYILDSNGRTIDIEQFNAAMKLRVKPDLPSPGLQTIFVKETKEKWRLFVKPLRGGMAIVGIENPEDITNVDKRLAETAETFGPSIEEASQVKTEDTDEYTQSAVLDDKLNLRSAVGGIPLLLEPSQLVLANRLNEIQAEDGFTYGMFTLPFTDSAGRTVGVIATFEKIDPKPWASWLYWIVNCLSSTFLAFIGTLVGIPYIGEKFNPRRLLHNSLLQGESSTVEFKESLRWSYFEGADQAAEGSKIKLSEEIAVKAIAAFLNNSAGGTLLIGISDKKQITGLQRDYISLLKKGDDPEDREKNRDRFQVHFRHLLSAKISGNIVNLCVKTEIVEAEGKDVCVVHASPSATPVFVGNGKKFCVRDGASSVELDVEEVVAFVEQRWPKALWQRLWNMLYKS